MLRQGVRSRSVANSDRSTIGAIRVIDKYCRQPAIFYHLNQGCVNGRTAQNNPVDGGVPDGFRICRRAVGEQEEGKPAALQSSGDPLQELLRGGIIEPELQRLAINEPNRVG